MLVRLLSLILFMLHICPLVLTTDLLQLFKRCAGAGHLRDEILHYRKELEKCPGEDDERQSYLMDMGIKALRLGLLC